MTADEDFEAYRREQLTQVRDIRVTEEGIHTFEQGLVRIIVRSEGSSQELKLNERELQELYAAAGGHLAKKIPDEAAELVEWARQQLKEVRTERIRRQSSPALSEVAAAWKDEAHAWRRYAEALELQKTQQEATQRSPFEAAPWEQLPDLPSAAAITAAQRHTEELAAAEGTQRIDLQDAVMDEIKAWSAYAKGLEQFLAAAGRAVRGADGPNRVPVELSTLTYAATALEGSADNGDRYAARQIREAIAKHPSPEAYAATQQADPSPWEAEQAHLFHAEHKPVQHRDGKEPWCKTCGLTKAYEQPKSRFDRPTVTIRDSAGAPLYAIETTPEHLLTFRGVLGGHEELYAASQDLEYGWAGDAQATTFYATQEEAEEFMGNPKRFVRAKAGPWKEAPDGA